MAATQIASLSTDAKTVSTMAKLFSAAVPTTKLQLMVASPQVLLLIVRPVAFFVIMTWILGAISPTVLMYHNLLDTSAIARQLDLAYPNSSYHLFKVANRTHNSYSNLGLNNGVCNGTCPAEQVNSWPSSTPLSSVGWKGLDFLTDCPSMLIKVQILT